MRVFEDLAFTEVSYKDLQTMHKSGRDELWVGAPPGCGGHQNFERAVVLRPKVWNGTGGSDTNFERVRARRDDQNLHNMLMIVLKRYK